MNDLVPSSPDAERLRAARERLTKLVTDSVPSPHSRRAYGVALAEFFRWLDARPYATPTPEFHRALVQEYRAELLDQGKSPSTVNVRLAALRKLAEEAAANQLLDPAIARAIQEVKGVKQHGVRAGNWLLREEARQLLAAPDPKTLRGKRDRAILALFLGCALRRGELAALQKRDLQMREGRWVLVDLVGKGRRVRTVAVPGWVKQLVDEWLAAAKITEGYLFRALVKGNRLARSRTEQGLIVSRENISETTLWRVIKEYAQAIDRDELAPHDLRRTTAKLCRAKGGDLEQIQMLLGHASIQTTERYLGSKLNLVDAVNDGLGLMGDDDGSTEQGREGALLLHPPRSAKKGRPRP
jgi:integrase